ncbi:MAG: type II toxin-antitoxin system VapB family antitoxin [Nitrococcus sp.]|nr:type II toxin-antitoxin system VapB family antitoxin [Nitrococcus sp.]
MALQIANPVVVEKVERLARATGLNKTAVVDKALDLLANAALEPSDPVARFDALLSQMDRLPDRADAYDPLHWDAHGLPE